MFDLDAARAARAALGAVEHPITGDELDDLARRLRVAVRNKHRERIAALLDELAARPPAEWPQTVAVLVLLAARLLEAEHLAVSQPPPPQPVPALARVDCLAAAPRPGPARCA